MSYTKPNALTYHAIRIFYKRGTVYFHNLTIKRRMMVRSEPRGGQVVYDKKRWIGKIRIKLLLHSDQ